MVEFFHIFPKLSTTPTLRFELVSTYFRCAVLLSLVAPKRQVPAFQWDNFFIVSETFQKNSFTFVALDHSIVGIYKKRLIQWLTIRKTFLSLRIDPVYKRKILHVVNLQNPTAKCYQRTRKNILLRQPTKIEDLSQNFSLSAENPGTLKFSSKAKTMISKG